jgi:short-subunit dehydrogenase
MSLPAAASRACSRTVVGSPVDEVEGGVDRATADVMAAAQRPWRAARFGAPSGPPAWKALASWYLLGTEDRVLPVDRCGRRWSSGRSSPDTTPPTTISPPGHVVTPELVTAGLDCGSAAAPPKVSHAVVRGTLDVTLSPGAAPRNCPESPMSVSLRPLEQQVVVITGASSGIGLVTARCAAQRGAAVVLAARNEQALTDLVEEIRAAGGRALPVVADVGRQEDVASVASAAIEEFGRFDTWVNNAGVSIFGEIPQVSVDDMHRVFDTVFWGVVYGCLQAVEHYRTRGGPGAIVNVGSLFGDRSTPIQSTYASAKHAVHGFTDGLRVELRHEGDPISVTLVHPGRIDTPYNEHAQAYVGAQPAHRGMIYPPEAVAAAILSAAEHPVRDVYVGSQAKLVQLAGALTPRLVDKIMSWYMWPTQMDPNRESLPREQSALWHAGYGGQERGSHVGWHRRGSWTVAATTHPVVTVVTGVAATVLGAAATARLPRLVRR